MKQSLLTKAGLLVCVAAATMSQVKAQTKPVAEQMAATVMDIWKDSLTVEVGKPVKWSYDQGVILEGIDQIWKRTGDGSYFAYMQKSMDLFVNKEGAIRGYKQQDFNIDNVKNGRALLTLYKVTGQQKYFTAASHLWDQLQKQPRTTDGGFWHKKIYPSQMWLDGLYMGEPFYAEYASLIGDTKAFDDIARQFILMETHARDAKTGLLYHGWDESKAQRWADKNTGTSPNFWGRAMGWYGMALVDVLDYFPVDHPKRPALIAILDRLAQATVKYQDPASGLWFDLLDQPKTKGNYKEASASSMFTYTLAKGVRKGYLAKTYFAAAKKAYAGMKAEFVEQGAKAGQVNLKGTVSVSGLGGTPYRDGTVAYYLSEKVITNDAKGVGAFLMAANEMELAAMPKPGAGKTVLLDSYFNNEIKKDQSGNMTPWHYKWNERANSGFSMWGNQFEAAGFKKETLYQAPTAENLKSASVYIIVDPDTKKETPDPKFIGEKDIKVLTTWVKNGGVLVLMANDTGNVELDHFNQLVKNFGVQFNYDSKGRVTGSQFEMAKINIAPGNPVFKTARQVYIKEFSSLNLSAPAVSILKDRNGDQVVASSKYGKGTVLIIGDPWLYDEYVDGRKLPVEYDNFKAGADLADWLAKQIPGYKAK
ncbi:glycoside hydrolase family 88 protein [Pedobacter duraquae]|uniref:Unsaturated rhamnogalacturonyl hydrolase n=1 Tax=Pedobacter duraquae TaxID=425511 RepID=A0A4R6IL34_9SPHI|nr:glycoside hydrolase family 88 protein [Pedobacter duraquae]TDO22783.1 unsaturated rhamnogalacturonyl hydrolase [Pedobacter duraquae]